MKDVVRLRLCDMIAQYKEDPELLKKVCEDARFCRNLLADFCPGPNYKRERELLIAVVADQGTAELYQSQNSDLDEAAVRRLIARMVDDHSYSDQAVRWAVESWIAALEFKVPDFLADPPVRTVPPRSIPPQPFPLPPKTPNLRKRVRKVPLPMVGLGIAAVIATTLFLLLRNPGPPDYSNFTRLTTLPGHSGSVECIAFSPDGKSLASSSDHQVVIIWDISTASPRGASDRFIDPIIAVTYSPDGSTLGILEKDSGLAIKDVAGTGGVRPRQEDAISFAFSPDSGAVAGLRKDGTVNLWDTRSGTKKPLPKYVDPTETIGKEDHPAPVNLVAYSPDGKSLAAGVHSNLVVWDTKSGESRPLKRHSFWVNSLSFSPDGSTLASGGADTQIIIWDVATGDFRPPMRQHGPVTSVAFLPDTKRLIFWSDSKTLASVDDSGLKLWEVGTWSARRFQPGDGVKAFAFSPGSNTLALARGSNIEIWGKQ